MSVLILILQIYRVNSVIHMGYLRKVPFTTSEKRKSLLLGIPSGNKQRGCSVAVRRYMRLSSTFQIQSLSLNSSSLEPFSHFRCILVQGPPTGCIQPEYRLPMQPIGFRCRGPMWMSDETPLPGIYKEEGINAGDRIDSNGLLNNRIGKILAVNILWSHFKYGP